MLSWLTGTNPLSIVSNGEREGSGNGMQSVVAVTFNSTGVTEVVCVASEGDGGGMDNATATIQVVGKSLLIDMASWWIHYISCRLNTSPLNVVQSL